jgi:hypothetical protein
MATDFLRVVLIKAAEIQYFENLYENLWILVSVASFQKEKKWIQSLVI